MVDNTPAHDGSTYWLTPGQHTITATFPNQYSFSHWGTPPANQAAGTSLIVATPTSLSTTFTVAGPGAAWAGDIALYLASGGGSTQVTLNANITITSGFPIPDVGLTLIEDGVPSTDLGTSYTISAQYVTLNTPISKSWTVATGHKYHIAMHLSNAVGFADVTSSEVSV